MKYTQKEIELRLSLYRERLARRKRIGEAVAVLCLFGGLMVSAGVFGVDFKHATDPLGYVVALFGVVGMAVLDDWR